MPERNVLECRVALGCDGDGLECRVDAHHLAGGHVERGEALQIDQLLLELREVAGGASGFKAVRGEYGSGKTFFTRWLAASKFPRDQVGIYLIGPSVGPHTGPGVYGAVILPKA